MTAAECEVTEPGLQTRAVHGAGEREQMENEYGEKLRLGDHYTSSSGCVPGDAYVATVSQTPVLDKASANKTLILGGVGVAAVTGLLLLGLIAGLLLRRRRRQRVTS